MSPTDNSTPPPNSVPNTESAKETSLLEKAITSAPIVLTVLATILAGMSSGEMTRAQYSRSLATQQQSKASDQWAFYQAKRIRATSQSDTAELLQSMTGAQAFDRPMLENAMEALQHNASTAPTQPQTNPTADTPVAAQKGYDSWTSLRARPDVQRGIECLANGNIPAQKVEGNEKQLQVVIEQIDQHVGDEKVDELAVSLPADVLLGAVVRAERNAAEFQKLFSEPLKGIDALTGSAKEAIRVAKSLDRHHDHTAALTPQADDLDHALTIARLRLNAARQDTEARFNLAIAQLYEVQVHKSGAEAERHRQRSATFFYGMLLAQGGVTVATFALALRKHSFLWGIATAAGLLAVSIGVYAYLL